VSTALVGAVTIVGPWVSAMPTTVPTAVTGPLPADAAPRLVADGDVLFEYGYVWLPYAIAAVIMLGLGAVAAVRWRHGVPRTAELLFTSGALLAVLAAIVLGLADGATEGNGLASIDPPVWRWMIEHRSPGLTTAAKVVTEVGSTLAMSILAVTAVIYLFWRGRRGDAALVAVVAAGAGALVRFGKATVGRDRPPANLRLVAETNESFPSGHALASAAIVGVLLVVFVPSIGRHWVRAGVIGAALLFVLCIGLSRLYLGVHWATDVLGGWVTGLAWLMLCLTVRQVWRQTRGRPQDLLDPDPAAAVNGERAA
jgi:undecaprenyl-diphosphatase